MIVQEDYKDGLVRTYSDLHVPIRQIETGQIFGEAIDIKPSSYTYEEVI